MFGKSLVKVQKVQKSSESSEKVWKLSFSKLSKNYEKMTLNLNFESHEKLVPTQKPTQKFGLKFGMLGLNSSVFQSFLSYSLTEPSLEHHSIIF
jgi:hypothetical protein